MWARQCISCQRSKILRHNQSPLHSIKPTCAKFSHIFIDIVCPLPSSDKLTYLLTIIDLYSRWTEAIPLSDTTSQTVCQTLISNWVARFGVPESISSDRGPNFESKLFFKFSECLGIKKIRTTIYHPQANLVERFHRRLRARAHWPLCSTTCGRALWRTRAHKGDMCRRHVCYVCKRSVCGGDEPQPVAHLSHKLQCARQSLKIMVSYGNKYPRHNARPHVVEQSGQSARALKEAIHATATSSPHDWLDRLPLIMLALRER